MKTTIYKTKRYTVYNNKDLFKVRKKAIGLFESLRLGSLRRLEKIQRRRYNVNIIDIVFSSSSKLEGNMVAFILKDKLVSLIKSCGYKVGNRKRLKSKLLSCSLSIVGLPRVTKKIVTLKSPHVHKKAKVHFLLHKYKRLIRIKLFYRGKNIDETQMERLLIKKVESNMPKSINFKLKVKKNTVIQQNFIT